MHTPRESIGSNLNVSRVMFPAFLNFESIPWTFSRAVPPVALLPQVKSSKSSSDDISCPGLTSTVILPSLSGSCSCTDGGWNLEVGSIVLFSRIFTHYISEDRKQLIMRGGQMCRWVKNTLILPGIRSYYLSGNFRGNVSIHLYSAKKHKSQLNYNNSKGVTSR